MNTTSGYRFTRRDAYNYGWDRAYGASTCEEVVKRWISRCANGRENADMVEAGYLDHANGRDKWAGWVNSVQKRRQERMGK